MADINSIMEAIKNISSATIRWFRACEKRAINRNVESTATFLS
ncbi:MAG: hypothetical protein ACXACP_00645 [Candidatus Hodarchaeales archaeon]